MQYINREQYISGIVFGKQFIVINGILQIKLLENYASRLSALTMVPLFPKQFERHLLYPVVEVKHIAPDNLLESANSLPQPFMRQ